MSYRFRQRHFRWFRYDNHDPQGPNCPPQDGRFTPRRLTNEPILQFPWSCDIICKLAYCLVTVLRLCHPVPASPLHRIKFHVLSGFRIVPGRFLHPVCNCCMTKRTPTLPIVHPSRSAKPPQSDVLSGLRDGRSDPARVFLTGLHRGTAVNQRGSRRPSRPIA
jgi:hypothetical protein